MKTADKIIRDFMGWSDTEVGYPNGFGKDVVEKMINQARKEAIEECVEKAIPELDYMANPNTPTIRVFKPSILSLINELK